MNALRLAAILLLLILLVPAIQPAFGTADARQTSTSWWNSSYGFRRALTVANPTNQPLVRQPVVVHLAFNASEVFDASSDLRLINSSVPEQPEVPSFVIDQQYTGGSVSSATVLFLASLGPSSTATFELYYGDASAHIPNYRTDKPVSGFVNGPISVQTAPTRPGSNKFSLTYGNTYSESLLSKVFLGPSKRSLGSTEISGDSYGNSTGWSLVGNLTADSVQVASASFTAGSVRDVTAMAIYPDHVAVISVLSAPTGAMPAPTTLVELANASALASLGAPELTFNSQSGLFVTSVAGAVVGLQSTPSPVAYDVAGLPSLVSDAVSGTFPGRTVSTGPSGAVFAWNLGRPLSHDIEVFSFDWLIGSSVGQLKSEGGAFTPIQASTSTEEVQSAFLPSASLIWTASLPMRNTSVGSKGLQLPLTIGKATWLPGTAQLSGQFVYEVPGQSFAQSPAGWSTGGGSTGNSSFLSTTNFFSLDRGANVARLSASSPALNGSAYAALNSNAYVVPGAGDSSLVIGYRASVEAYSGLPSVQTFYAALDIGSGFNGTVAETLFFPVAGTSSSSSPLACGATKLSSPLPSNKTILAQGGSLIADGTWRSLNISLANLVEPSGFQARLRFCEAITGTFVGNLNMLVSAAEVKERGAAQNLLSGTLSYSTPMLGLGFRSPGTFALQPVVFDGEMTFSVATQASSYAVNGTGFAGTASSPIVLLNTTSGRTGSPRLDIAPTSLTLQTHFSSLLRSLAFGNSVVKYSASGGIVYSDQLGAPARAGNVTTPVSYAAVFGGVRHQFSVVGSDLEPVPGAILNFIPANESLTAFTGRSSPSGILLVDLLPWQYQLGVAFGGASVGSSTIAGNHSTPDVVSVNVYRINIGVTDAVHRALQGAQVEISLGGYNASGFTDSRGQVSFLAAANQIYHLNVQEGGSVLYSGTIKSTPNNALIQIPTTYYSPPLVLALAVTVVGMVVAVSAVIYLAKWWKPRKKP